MLIILSPAKSLNYSQPLTPIKTTNAEFLGDSKKLVDVLKKLSIPDLEKLMAISPKLAQLNWQRFQDFSLPFNNQNSHPALFLFAGDVYKSMAIANYNQKDLDFAQNHLRILSGLYGILKPLDLIQPYRLEMSTHLKPILGKNLPQFWQKNIADFFNRELKNHQEKTIINLASEEYFAAIDATKINGKIINIIFKEQKGASYKIIGLMAKKARGLMADFVIKNKIKKAEDLQEFRAENYRFKPKFSNQTNWHFYR
ncbi:MAG: peroxide stress protein YaaA [Pseudomonadota bacterium]